MGLPFSPPMAIYTVLFRLSSEAEIGTTNTGAPPKECALPQDLLDPSEVPPFAVPVSMLVLGHDRRRSTTDDAR